VNISDTGNVVLDVTFSPSSAPRRAHHGALKKTTITTTPAKPKTAATTAGKTASGKTITTTSTPTKTTALKTSTANKIPTPGKTATTSKASTPSKTAATTTPSKRKPSKPTPSPSSSSTPSSSTPSSSSTSTTTPPSLPLARVAYRVSLDALGSRSPYFRNLLTNPSFSESRLVTTRLAALSLPASAATDSASLPWIPIVDDDLATYCPDRAPVLADLLRILHSQPLLSTTVNENVPDVFAHAVTLVILADRYDCLDAVRPAVASLKFKWPTLTPRAGERLSSSSSAAEETLRKTILVAYRAGNAPRLLTLTRELIMRGSLRWAALLWDESDNPAATNTTSAAAAWWTLPDGLERELQHRRDCILNTLASVPRHFIRAYSSRTIQCQRGYDSSPACDSFQLGQMLKFLARKDLVYLFDFGPSSLDGLPDSSRLQVGDVLALLKECPAYQIDKHHTNCGLKTRLEPILQFIEAMLGSSQTIGIRLEDWRLGPGQRDSWIPATTTTTQAADKKNNRNRRFDDDVGVSNFEFTRAMVRDGRQHHQAGMGMMGTDALARKLFTSNQWDWTPEMRLDPSML
jgi:hypothetical protein